MAKKLKNINGHFVESDYENALIAFLETEGWQYTFGEDIARDTRRDVVFLNDLTTYLKKQFPTLQNDDIRKIADNIRLVGADWSKFGRCIAVAFLTKQYIRI